MGYLRVLPKGIASRKELPVVSILAGLLFLCFWSRDVSFITQWLGHYLVLVGCISYLVFSRKSLEWTSKYFWVPVTVITVASICAYREMRLLNIPTTLYYGYMFLLFLIGGSNKTKYLACIPVLGIVLAASVIWESCSYYAAKGIFYIDHDPWSGIFSNSDVAGGFLVISLFFVSKRNRWMIPILLVGLFFTGAHSALLGLGFALVYMLFRFRKELVQRLRGKFLIGTVGLLIVLVGFLSILGITQRLWEVPRFGYFIVRVFEGGSPVDALNELTKDRVGQIGTSIENISLFGTSPVNTNPLMEQPWGPPPYDWHVHNAPLRVLDTLGIFASLSWLFIMGVLIKKSKLRLLFIALFGISLLENYIWQPYISGPLVWYLWGVGSKV